MISGVFLFLCILNSEGLFDLCSIKLPYYEKNTPLRSNRIPLVKREFYYDARLISGQYGTEFTNQEYGKIKKVISIWICLNPSQYCMDTINRYRITEENVVGDYKLETSDYDVMEVIIACLHDGEKERKHSEMIDMLFVLFSDKLNGEKKQRILEEEYKLKMTQEYKEVVDSMCNMSEVYERKANEKVENVEKQLVKQREEFDEKLAEEKRKTVLNMLEKNLDDDLIISCAGVTAELLEEIKTGIKG